MPLLYGRKFLEGIYSEGKLKQRKQKSDMSKSGKKGTIATDSVVSKVPRYFYIAMVF